MSKLNRCLLTVLLLLLAAVALTIVVQACAQKQVTVKLEIPETPTAADAPPPLVEEPSQVTGATEIEAQENPWQEESPLKYMGEFRITHYCPCEECCDKAPDHPDYGITATRTVATEGRTIAVDPDVIPYGSRVAIYYDDGRLGYYTAEDRGCDINGLDVDVFIADHERAWNMGVKSGSVYIISEE